MVTPRRTQPSHAEPGNDRCEAQAMTLRGLPYEHAQWVPTLGGGPWARPGWGWEGASLVSSGTRPSQAGGARDCSQLRSDAAEPTCTPLCPSFLPESGFGWTWQCQEIPIQELAQRARCHQRRQEQAHRPGKGQSSQLGRSQGRLHGGDSISAGPQVPGRVYEEEEGHCRRLRGRR